jgi:starch synthase
MTSDNIDFKLKVLHVSPEVAPFAKRGGLGDVAGSLPKALCERGVDARVVMPAWPGVLDYARDHGYLRKRAIGNVSVALDWKAWTARIWRAVIDKLQVYIIEQKELFNDVEIYPEQLTAQNVIPFLFLSFVPFEMPKLVKWNPQFYHAHDWGTAALPSALRWHRYYSSLRGEYDTIFTIHNMAFQGLLDPAGLNGWGFMPNSYDPYNPGSMEFFGQANLLKGAVITSDAITTVSPSYSWDIQTQKGGFGMDGVIVEHKNKLRGILNGIDHDVWNPETDEIIAANYNVQDLSGKAECRAALIERCGWEEDDGLPVLTFIGRLAEQKGIDIMLGALEGLEGRAKVVIIGSGSNYYSRKIKDFAEAHADYIKSFMAFSEELAHITYAGSDILMMPSLFEPCGLSQLIASAYGTIPVARATGGIADTIIDADSSYDGTGFLFTDYSVSEFKKALDRALEAKTDADRWAVIVRNAMKRDFSWEASAQRYVELYRQIISS